MIFDTILYTGIRREELTKILKSDIEPTKITVRDGKGGKMRVIYLPEHFSLSLHTYMKKTN
jgi:site-specific recombinase XerD